MMSISRPSGFTLMQLLAAVAVAGILAATALPAYQKHVRDARLRQAHAALLENSRFLEHFYAQNHGFKANSTTWPELPVSSTGHFCIRLQGNPRGTPADRYTLKAVAVDVRGEARVLRLNQDLTATLCEESSSRCSETQAFFSNANGTDKNCRPFR